MRRCSFGCIVPVIILVLCAANVDGATSCIPGWTRFQNSCYFFSRLRLSWNPAELYCRGLVEGGKLTEIESVEEDDFLRTHLNHTFGPNKRFWTGGTDVAKEGTWVWIRDRQTILYTDWGPSEPAGMGYENCLEMAGHLGYQWNDNECYIQNYFVCEEELLL